MCRICRNKFYPKNSVFTRSLLEIGIKQKGAVTSTLTKQNKTACLFL